MSGALLLEKLRMQPSRRVLILNAPSGYLDELGELPEGVEVLDRAEGTFDFVQVFAKDLAELEKLAPVAVRAVKHDGLLWVSYPKKSAKVASDLSREVVWEAVAKTGLRPVAQVSVNDVWSALRLRPPEKVEKRRSGDRFLIKRDAASSVAPWLTLRWRGGAWMAEERFSTRSGTSSMLV